MGAVRVRCEAQDRFWPGAQCRRDSLASNRIDAEAVLQSPEPAGTTWPQEGKERERAPCVPPPPTASTGRTPPRSCASAGTPAPLTVLGPARRSPTASQSPADLTGPRRLGFHARRDRGTENRAHYVGDVILGEDAQKSRIGSQPSRASSPSTDTPKQSSITPGHITQTPWAVCPEGVNGR